MYFTLFKGNNGQWYWSLKAGNHKTIADGAEGYNNKQDAIHAINLIRQNAGSAGIDDRSTDTWL